jgi:aldose 1-epimerase
VLEISTNQRGIHFYDGKYLDGFAIGRMGTAYGPHAGLCLKPQNFPDAPNQANFPKSRLEPAEVYADRVAYKFESS